VDKPNVGVHVKLPKSIFHNAAHQPAS